MVSVHTAVGWSESTMNDDDVTEKLLDALVYALELALEAKDLLPKLAERGRRWPSLAWPARSPRRRGQSEAVKLVDELRTGVEAFFTANSDKRPPTPPRASPVPTPSCRSRGTPHSLPLR